MIGSHAKNQPNLWSAPSKSPEELAADLDILAGLFSTAFNANPLPAPIQSTAAAINLANLETTQQALEFLTNFGIPNRSYLTE